ncbi:hypothetical protein FIBSPDRAFT_63613 [Athelia psychrophila]|uniref:Uncharacterized protein n=1 Tax=Athelia psychrophila TaxID=1759441 RepID=A0A166EYS5_9AGAM|nr:hypothetical protein FIBSPDRAFT_63613 [Fibularhizoctonia sp. CBS 109695]
MLGRTAAGDAETSDDHRRHGWVPAANNADRRRLHRWVPAANNADGRRWTQINTDGSLPKKSNRRR